MDIINNEKDRREFSKALCDAIKPIEKALKNFTKVVSKIDFDEINRLIKK